MRFLEDSRVMPVIWNQTLLAYVQRYKHELRKEDKDSLNTLMQNQRHYLVTLEISRQLNNSRNRGEKEDDHMMMSSPVSVTNKIIQKDIYDIPEVPMEELVISPRPNELKLSEKIDSVLSFSKSVIFNTGIFIIPHHFLKID